MLIENYISRDFPIFSIQDLVKDAFAVVSDFDFSHIFVEKDGSFLGAIGKGFLAKNSSDTLEKLMIYTEKFSILDQNTVLDSIKLFHTFNTNIIPVISKNEEYQGYISWDDISAELSKYPFFSENGAFLTVETPRKGYSMVEIAQIVESNNCKFYGAVVSDMNDDFVRVTMRISHENLSSVDETFERYGYVIIQKFYTDEKEELLKSRYQFMQKFLEF